MRNPKKMLGKTFFYRTEEYLVLDITQEDRKTFKVKTNKGDLLVSAATLRKDFLPSDPDREAGKPMRNTVPPPNVGTIKALVAEELKPVGTLADILIENMKTLKEKKDFIPQAKAINEQAKTLIALAKVKLDAVRLFRR